MRLFTAILLPSEVRQHLVDVKQYVASRVRDIPGVKWVAEGNLHLTMKFLGEVDDERVPPLKQSLATVRVQPMTLFAERIGAFPTVRRAHVLTVSPGGDVPQVESLYDEIDRACQVIGVPRERRAFTPHMTLGRSQKGVNIERVALQKPDLFPGPVFVASEFQLMKSTLTPKGSIYDVIETYP